MFNRINRVSTRIVREFKGTAPFDKEVIPEEQQLSEYIALTPEAMNERIQREGQEATNTWIGQMEDLKRRRNYA